MYSYVHRKADDAILDTDTLIAGTSASPLLVIVVQLLKGSTPPAWWQGKAGDQRAILLTLVLGPLLLLAAWVLGGFLPGWMTWQDAVRTGLTTALQASGLYAVSKRLITPAPPALRSAAPEPPAVVAARAKRG